MSGGFKFGQSYDAMSKFMGGVRDLGETWLAQKAVDSGSPVAQYLAVGAIGVIEVVAPGSIEDLLPVGKASKLIRTDRGSALKAQGFQEHHIISWTNERTKNHELLELADYDLQSRANKIFLPRDETLHPTRSIHSGRHFNSVSEDLGRQMDEVVRVGRQQEWTQAQYRKAIDALVSQERQALRTGVRALNSNARP